MTVGGKSITRTKMNGNRNMDNLNINIMLNGEPIEPAAALEILKAAAGKKRTNGQRVSPTIEQVREYVRARGNKIDPDQFFDFYEANGWVQSKKPIKDWRACVRTWERNDYGQKYREDRTIKERNGHGKPDSKLQAMSARRQLIQHFRRPEAADWDDARCIAELIGQVAPLNTKENAQ